MGQKKSFKIAVCALGRIGWRHAVHVQATPGLSLAAVCDLNKELLVKAAGEFKVPTYTSFAKMLSAAGADMVVIATSSHLHFSMTKDALKCGYHVLVEKPMAKNAGEVREMIRLARKAGKYLTVNQSMRYRPDVRYIRETIKKGVIGDVFQLYMGINNNFSERTDWQIWKKFNGGMVANWGVHLVDSILQMTDQKPRHVFAKLNRIIDRGDAEDAFKIVIKFNRGLVAEVEAQKARYGKLLWQACGTKGTIAVENTGGMVIEIKTRTITGKETVEKVDWRVHTEDLPAHYRDLAKRVFNGQPPPVTPESVLTQFKIIDAAKKSNRIGCSVEVR